MAGPGRSGDLLAQLPKKLLFRLFDGAASGEAKAGSVLFVAGEDGNGLYAVRTGILKVIVAAPDGRERIVALLGPGSIAGELAMIDGLPRSASVVAMHDCSYKFVSRPAFDKFAAAHPDFYRELVMILATRLREADTALAAATFLSVKGRVARALVEIVQALGLSEQNGRVVLTHKIGNNDLAAMAGVARENVSRVLGEWRERGLVTQSSGYHCIADLAALEAEIAAEI